MVILVGGLERTHLFLLKGFLVKKIVGDGNFQKAEKKSYERRPVMIFRKSLEDEINALVAISMAAFHTDTRTNQFYKKCGYTEVAKDSEDVHYEKHI